MKKEEGNEEESCSIGLNKGYELRQGSMGLFGDEFMRIAIKPLGCELEEMMGLMNFDALHRD